MTDENLEICMWKRMLEDLDSTSGQAMKGDQSRKCKDCDGTEEYALSINCKAGLGYFQLYGERENDR